MKNSSWLKILIIGLFSFFFASVLYRVTLNCASYYDFGIYSEALRQIRWGNLNPIIPGRNIHIFNDHFDPILIPIAYFTRWLPAPILGLGIEFLTLIAIWFPLSVLLKGGKITEKTALFGYAFLLLNHATLDAVGTPFHPTTWGYLPLLFIYAYYWLGDFRKMTASLVVLFLCREEFPFIGLTLGATLFFDRKKGWGALVTSLGIIFILFDFVLRPSLFEGGFSDYGGTLVRDLLSDPLKVLKDNLTLGQFRMHLERLLPLIALVPFKSLWDHRRYAIRAIFIILPILGIRFISNKWGFHYGTAAIAGVFFAFLPSLNLGLSDAGASRIRLRISLAFLLIAFTSATGSNFFKEDSRCSPHQDRVAALNAAQDWIQNSGKKRILLENNLASIQILKAPPDQEIYTLCSPNGTQVAQFDVVLIEKPNSGDPWPCNYSRISELLAIWRTDPDIQIVTDNPWIFLATGLIKPGR